MRGILVVKGLKALVCYKITEDIFHADYLSFLCDYGTLKERQEKM